MEGGLAKNGVTRVKGARKGEGGKNSAKKTEIADG